MTPENIFDLSGRVAIVTGGRQGLGYAMALGLARAGARIWLAARTPDQASEAASRLLAQGYQARPIAFDVTSNRAVREALSELLDAEGRLDILINNAAVRLRRPLESVSVEDVRSHLDINLAAQFSISTRAAEVMAQGGWGRIIMISSIAACRGARDNAAYSAAKGGLEAMMRAFACQYGALGITCNAIAPGKFATEFNAEALSRPEALRSIDERCPLRRHGAAHEIVGPCLFLASEASSYVTGHVLTVDGGYSIQM